MDQNGLIRNKIIEPKSSDWRVRFFFVDGSSQTIRVSPGGISHEKAVAAAKRSIKLLDESVLDRIETERAESIQVAPFGMVKKGK
jgi:hypothetical protein|tara:strand:- start:701 stop:955 length:255 start_codon:yes stop_codon:yes gene_type:complete